MRNNYKNINIPKGYQLLVYFPLSETEVHHRFNDTFLLWAAESLWIATLPIKRIPVRFMSSALSRTMNTNALFSAEASFNGRMFVYAVEFICISIRQVNINSIIHVIYIYSFSSLRERLERLDFSRISESVVIAINVSISFCNPISEICPDSSSLADDK